PRRVEFAAADQPSEQISIWDENVDGSITGAGSVICLARALLGKGHEQLAADVVDSEGRKPGRDRRIREAVHELEMTVEDVHRSEAEVARVEELAGRCGHQSQALVDRADVTRAVGRGRFVDGDDRVRPIDV